MPLEYPRQFQLVFFFKLSIINSLVFHLGVFGRLYMGLFHAYLPKGLA